MLLAVKAERHISGPSYSSFSMEMPFKTDVITVSLMADKVEILNKSDRDVEDIFRKRVRFQKFKNYNVLNNYNASD